MTALLPKGDGCKAEGAANGNPIGKPDNTAGSRFGSNPQGRWFGGMRRKAGQRRQWFLHDKLAQRRDAPAKPPALPRDSMRQVPAISE